MSRAGGADDSPIFQLGDIARILGRQVFELVQFVGKLAHEGGIALFLVGVVVRDLWLGQRNLDLDFVTEGDAIEFAESLAKRCGGSIQAHRSFGTAKWTLDAGAAAGLSLALDRIPSVLDFATARSETYDHPTALPRVAASDIGQDLERRDFTVNALALQLSPQSRAGRLIDAFDGVKDLQRRRIRVLHDQSFVDDPTRILRALRHSQRLGFEVERHTARWMGEALPWLARVSGQRLRNEIDLILREPEAGEVLLRLQDLGALAAIHPPFRISARLPDLIDSGERPPWKTEAVDRRTLRWCILLTGTGAADVRGVCERLALTKALSQAVTASAKLTAVFGRLADEASRPSDVTRILDAFPDAALQVGWLLAAGKPQARANLSAYASDWRYQRSIASGADLKTMGVAPGPIYRRILDRLRYAWIDGEIRSAEEERALLQRLLEAKD